VAGGFVAGAFTSYYVLWRAHALAPGHPLALRTSEIGVRPFATARPTAAKTPTPASSRRDEPTPLPRDGRP